MSINKDNDFSFSHYVSIINDIKKTHKVLSFKDVYELGERLFYIPKFCILRHDIEFSLSWALQLARLDAEAGVRATFFLLQTSEYNPFEEEQAMMVREILDLGHDIGLHYDAALFERLGLDAELVAQKQIELFEAFFQTKIYAMSSHMPMRSGVTFSIEGVIDTYDPTYMTRMRYITDSTQAWRAGVVTRHLEKEDRIHLLMHEYTWSEEGTPWEANLLIQSDEIARAAWDRARERIVTFRQGLALREKKDKEFRKRFMQE